MKKRQKTDSFLDPDLDAWHICISRETMSGKIVMTDTGINAIDAVLYNNRCNEKKEGKTMANIVSKDKLDFIDGYLSLDGTLVSPGFVGRYKELEDFLQKTRYGNSLSKGDEPFREKSIFPNCLIEVPAPKTPALDKRAKRVDAEAEESRLLLHYDDVVSVLERFSSVVEFVCGENVVLYDGDYYAGLIDTPMLGNPLELTKEKLLRLVCEAVEYPLDQVADED